MGYDKNYLHIKKSEKGSIKQVGGYVMKRKCRKSKFWNSSGKNKRTHTIEN